MIKVGLIGAGGIASAHIKGYKQHADKIGRQTLARHMPPGTRWTRPDGGMFVWVRLPDGSDADALLRESLARDLAFVPGWPFFSGPPDRATLRLSFTTHATDEIATGLQRLRGAVAALHGRG